VKVALGDCSFVDIGGIVDHHCLNFLFIIILPDPFHRIVGGCPVNPPHSWPWTIQLRIDENSLFFHYCGAVLLSPWFALTASHCFLPNTNFIFFEARTHDLQARWLLHYGCASTQQNIKYGHLKKSSKHL
jgi:hypothetical protein